MINTLILIALIQTQITQSALADTLSPPFFRSHSSGIIHPAGIMGPDQLKHLKSLKSNTTLVAQLEANTPLNLNSAPYYTAPIPILSSYTNKDTSTQAELDALMPTQHGLVAYAGRQAYSQTLMYEITGNVTYAENVMTLFKTWTTNTRFPTFVPNSCLADPTGCQNSPLLWGWAMASWFKAAELLKYTYPNWDKTIETQMINWFEKNKVIALWKHNVLVPNSYSSVYSIGNWHTTICEAMFYYYALKDDAAGMDYVKSYYMRMVDGERNPSNPAQGDPIYIASTGEEYETCRDADHANYGIGGLVQLAEAFWHQGIDLYSYGPRGHSGLPGLAQVLETNAYISLHNTFPSGISSNGSLWRINGFNHGSSCKLTPWSGYKPGGWHIGYNHFANRLGLPLPNTLKMNENYSDLTYYFHFGLGSITHDGTH